MRNVDLLDAPVEQFLGRQHFAVLVEPERLAEDETRINGREVLLHLRLKTMTE